MHVYWKRARTTRTILASISFFMSYYSICYVNTNEPFTKVKQIIMTDEKKAHSEFLAFTRGEILVHEFTYSVFLFFFLFRFYSDINVCNFITWWMRATLFHSLYSNIITIFLNSNSPWSMSTRNFKINQFVKILSVLISNFHIGTFDLKKCTK